MLRSWLPALLLAAALAAAGPGRADETTLGYHLVVHATAQHAVPIPGREKHAIGLAEFRGLAIFDDGRLARHWYAGSFDFVEGAGEFRGYAIWTFEDGSELRGRYTGEARAEADGIAFSGQHSELQGSGAYAGIEGDGRFTGQRIDRLDEGGDTYQRGTLTLRRPD